MSGRDKTYFAEIGLRHRWWQHIKFLEKPIYHVNEKIQRCIYFLHLSCLLFFKRRTNPTVKFNGHNRHSCHSSSILVVMMVFRYMLRTTQWITWNSGWRAGSCAPKMSIIYISRNCLFLYCSVRYRSQVHEILHEYDYKIFIRANSAICKWI